MSNLAPVWLHRASNIAWAPILVVFITTVIIITAPFVAIFEVIDGLRRHWGEQP